MSAERTAVDMPVDEVVLLEDRAHVYRRARLELAAGRQRLRIEPVAPVLVDKTLSATVEAGIGVTVVGARVVREAVIPDIDSGSDELAALRRELEALEEQRHELAHESMLVAQHAAALDRVASLTHADLATDVAWGRGIDDAWRTRLASLRAEERELREREAELAFESRELDGKRQRLELRINELTHPGDEERAWIDLDVDVEAACAVTLGVDYVVPGACWRPRHTARLIEGDEARVVFSTDAAVWQNSGEDWHEAQLIFSTERVSLGTEPPRLTSDRLAWKRKSDAVVVAAREQAIATAGLGAQPAPAAARELPGIDDAGEAVNLRGLERADVPSDGRPHRVPLSRFETPARASLVAYPELSPCVFTKTVLTNKGDAPILAGPVELLRSSGPVGRTSVLYIAEGEQFELGWGPEAELRLKRTSRTRDEKSRVLSSWISRDHEVEVTMSNLGDEQRIVEVTERVPVSEIDKVEIAVDSGKSSRNADADSDGFVRWTVVLPAFGHEQLELRYTVKKHQDVVGF